MATAGGWAVPSFFSCAGGPNQSQGALASVVGTTQGGRSQGHSVRRRDAKTKAGQIMGRNRFGLSGTGTHQLQAGAPFWMDAAKPHSALQAQFRRGLGRRQFRSRSEAFCALACFRAPWGQMHGGTECASFPPRGEGARHNRILMRRFEVPRRNVVGAGVLTAFFKAPQHSVRLPGVGTTRAVCLLESIAPGPAHSLFAGPFVLGPWGSPGR